eukprot:9883026-Alexandrium_andersonii.AAC.1
MRTYDEENEDADECEVYDELMCQRLFETNALYKHKMPWTLSFAYGDGNRHAIEKFVGKPPSAVGSDENSWEAQRSFMARLKANARAARAEVA